MSSVESITKEKVVIINGKRFIVGNSKIKPTKCPDYNNPNRKKLLSKEQIREKVEEKKIEEKKIEEKNKITLRKSKRMSRKRRE